MRRKARIKPQVRFQAKLPLLITNDERRKSITKKIYDTLPKESRGVWHEVKTKPYYQIIRMAPYANPAIERLRNKLNRQRVKFTETVSEIEGREFVNFTTIGADLV